MKIIRWICAVLFLVLLILLQRLLSSGDFSNGKLLAGIILGAVIISILFFWSSAQVRKIENKE